MNCLEATRTHPAINLWIKNLQSSRRVQYDWAPLPAQRLTPQVEVLSPLLWNTLFDDLIKRFERKAPKITTYSDDIIIIIMSLSIDSHLHHGINTQGDM